MKDGLYANQVCSECGVCGEGSDDGKGSDDGTMPTTDVEPTGFPTEPPTGGGGECLGDSATYDAGYGPCPTYAPGAYNNYWCPYDKTADGLYAEQVCSECGKCGSPELIARSIPKRRPRLNISQIQKKSASASGAPCQADSATWDA